MPRTKKQQPAPADEPQPEPEPVEIIGDDDDMPLDWQRAGYASDPADAGGPEPEDDPEPDPTPPELQTIGTSDGLTALRERFGLHGAPPASMILILPLDALVVPREENAAEGAKAFAQNLALIGVL